MDLGVCYYPEQWPRETWSEDAAAMATAGLRYVRIGEFAWAAYEPERGRFEWAWLDEAVDALHAAGLQVILGTPTATPPIWLAMERPDILSVGSDDRRRPYGTRRHTCPTSQAYREESARIVELLVARYGNHDAVVAWQIDNEPGNHDSARCWCDECEAAFSNWLENRYGGIASLNAAWGTIFWSQVYPSFEAVRLPRPAPTDHSPSLELAHRRFASRQVVAALEEQASIIRTGSPGRDITTNFYAGDTFVDYRAVARVGGIGAIDSYPHGAASSDEVRFWHDLARGISGTNRGWIMEQQPGAINWTADNPPVEDGQVSEWLANAAEDGIERTLLFRWRVAPAGQETYHTAMLRFDGSEDRASGETKESAAILAEVEPAEVATALIYDYEDAWAFDIEPHQRGLSHRQLVVAAHSAAKQLGPVDIVGWRDDLTGYSLVIAPCTILGGEGRMDRLIDATAPDATIVVGPRSFTRSDDLTNAIRPTLAVPGGTMFVGESLSFPQPGATAGGAPIGPWLDLIDAPQDAVLMQMARDGIFPSAPVAARIAKDNKRIVFMGASSAAAWTELLTAISSG